ncbi:MAG: DUF4377 domain-containing protein [Cyanobacteriota bacterium]|nr:DUF4377 domain-containing protein [Cyanobacteriota bacterium]
MTFQAEQVKTVSSTTEERVVYVDSKTVPCTGVVCQECLQVRESSEDEWVLFYDAITGFDYEPGYDYTIRIAETITNDPSANPPLLQWSLIEIISKTSVN